MILPCMELFLPDFPELVGTLLRDATWQWISPWAELFNMDISILMQFCTCLSLQYLFYLKLESCKPSPKKFDVITSNYFRQYIQDIVDVLLQTKVIIESDGALQWQVH